MNVIIIEKTDNWHSYNNREILGVAESKAAALLFIRRYLKVNNFDKLSEDDEYNLLNISQTQNYTENFEFNLMEIKLVTIND